MNEITHILWDWNGTLLDDVDLSAEIISSILCRLNYSPLSTERHREVFCFPIREYYRRAGFDLDTHDFESLGREFISIYEERRLEPHLHPGAEQVVRSLDGRGFIQSVLSAYPHESLLEVLAHFGLLRYFRGPKGLKTKFPISKVETGRALLTELNADSSRALIIGDTTHDFEVARELGASCVLMANGHNSEQRLRDCGVPVIRGFQELEAFLPRPRRS